MLFAGYTSIHLENCAKGRCHRQMATGIREPLALIEAPIDLNRKWLRNIADLPNLASSMSCSPENGFSGTPVVNLHFLTVNLE